jgi:trimeric autotransporter adhesin
MKVPPRALCFGVSGTAASTSGDGVFGNATATTGNATGVFGQSASPSGNGVYGAATAASGSANGVNGQTNSASGNGVLGRKQFYRRQWGGGY